MTEIGPAKGVKALYNFKGSNNDELCFNKGDIITVTQMVDGGWWEGTIHGNTGWFPSNFVRELKQDARAGSKSPTEKPADLPMNKRESMMFYRNVVLQSLTDTERTFVTDLRSLQFNYLNPLQNTNILSPTETTLLIGNHEEIVGLHQNFLNSMDECSKLPIPQQKVGGLFLETAQSIKAKYLVYCANHPSAAAILQRRKDELSKFMESRGAPSPGIMTLTTSLSKPFARLDKYPSLLKEMERHTEESHADRGDTQRAIAVYREIAVECVEKRRMKEMEYDVMNSPINSWEGEEIAQLGEVLLMSHVRVHSENGEKRELLFVLFQGVLVTLSVSPRLSGYTYEGRLALSGLTVNGLDDTEHISHAFEITGSMIDRRVILCGTSFEKKQWVEKLKQQVKLGPRQVSDKPQSLQISTSQPSISTLSQAKTAQVVHQPFQHSKAAWNVSCLRPCPPLRPSVFVKDDITRSPRTGRKILGATRKKPERTNSEDDYLSHKRVEDSKTLEADALILKVIEAYCTSAKTRQTVNSSLLENPQVIIAEEEKIIVEEVKGDQTVVEEKTLVDTVYSLRDQVWDMKQEQQRLRKDLEDEKKSRKRLENLLRKSLLRSTIEQTPISIEDPVIVS